MKKYSDLLMDWLVDLGYTHCFFVAGGNIMHLLESCSRRLVSIPVVHEVAAGIAAEYFNESHTGEKAFAMVTAGPGLTNILTAIGGAYLESRELLVLGGQVKLPDLSRGLVRQRGIQEIDGLALAAPITEKSLRLEKAVDKAEFAGMIHCGEKGRKGPVFIEIPLDIQAMQVDETSLELPVPLLPQKFEAVPAAVIAKILKKLREAKRPVLLLGAGVDRKTAHALQEQFVRMGIPLMQTWNAIDRLGAEHPMYFGRPNTWGQRYSNVLLQQADVLLALGTRLSLQQSGFNWQEFVPSGEILQVDCDPAELSKGHPRVALPVCGDANAVLQAIAQEDMGSHAEWVEFCRSVKSELPLLEACNHTGESYLSPYEFVARLSDLATAEDVVIPCSSGGAYTVMMQAFDQKFGQCVINNKGLASMGYGLSGAIGAAVAAKGRRTILVEGDGGFIQNLQELGTVSANHLNLKIFLFDNNGYASIRMTQVNYFEGHSVGCDIKTGLGIPDWKHLFAAYGIPVLPVEPGFEKNREFLQHFHAPGASAFLVKIDPEQTYFPKITSRITPEGGMVSNPLHRMSPDLPAEVAAKVFRYLQASQ